MVCFTRDSSGFTLYPYCYGLHSDSNFFGISDGHPSLQESRRYLQWAYRVAYTSSVLSLYPYHTYSSYRDYRDDSVVCCIIRATSHNHSYTWGFSDNDSDSERCGSTSYSDTSRVTSHASYWVDLDRFTFTSSDKGPDRSELRVRGWCSLVLDLSSHLSARLDCSCPAVRPLGFGACRQRGRGSEYVRSRGSMWDGLDLVLLVFCVWCFVHSRLLSCIVLYTCDCQTYVTCVLSTLIYIYHVTWLCSFAVLPCFTLFQMSFTSCTHA